MDTQYVTLEEIRSILNQLRQDPNTQRRFPKRLWDSIIHLTKTHPLENICYELNINPSYLKNKIQQSKKCELKFQEVTLSPPLSLSGVTIELSSQTGLKAMIQGPISCLDCLHKLFGR